MHRTLGVAVALVVSACSAATEPTSAVSVRSDSEIYVRRGNVAIVPYTVVNDGGQPVRLTASCGDDPAAVVERRAGTRWVPYAGGVCQGIYPVGQVVLPPGAQRQSRVTLTEPGEYRLTVPVERNTAISSRFEVR